VPTFFSTGPIAFCGWSEYEANGMGERRGRLLVLWLLASTLAAFDLWVNVFLPTPAWAFHQRSAIWAIGCVVLLVAIVPLTRLPSPSVTIGAGFLAGGVLGNLISGASDHLAVPNPILLHTSTAGGIAFNFADAFIITGNVILVFALCTLVVKNRRQLQHKGALAYVLRRGR
jgi:Signal peptidase (SPase) II